MSFPRFAFNNIRRNARAYFAYFLSSAIMVMIFFCYAVFSYHPDVQSIEMGGRTATAMQVASYIVYIFAFFFVLYSISVFLKSRNREFGILTILGARAGQINRLIFLENMLIGLFAIIVGLASGLLLSKLFLLLSTKIIGVDNLPFYWPVKAAGITIVAFFLLFLAISLFTLLFIRKNNVLELLKGSSKPKKEPKVSALLSLLGIALLAAGYLALNLKTISSPSIIIAAVTGIAGTYFFYSQLSVLLTRLIKRNRRLTWKGTNLLWISEMSYKLKDNSRILFLITVVTALASMSSALVLGVDQSNRDSFKSNPFAFTYTVFKNPPGEPDVAPIRKELESQGVQYRQLKVTMLSESMLFGDRYLVVNIVSASQYRSIAELLHWEGLPELTDHDAVMTYSKNTEGLSRYKVGESIKIGSEPAAAAFEIKKVVQSDQVVTGSPALVAVNDEVFSRLNQDNRWLIYWYYVPEWNKHLPGTRSPESIAGNNLEKWQRSLANGGGEGVSAYLSARANLYLETKQGTSLFTFIGVFVALIFSLSSASFLYFKLHSELEEAGRMYYALSKIGLGVREMRTAASRQIAILFFVPIIISAVQTLVVVRPILEEMDITRVVVPVLLTFAGFLAAQIVFFLIVRTKYVHSLKKIMV
ncbi:FtsX-like permease family protein [Paenibacillus caui]|uniref:FtsX-like permease family protein n=1 Tax=Paenibacillus caui TaxID=2873927 RepID=UPI001CA7C3FE|nr:ABC transporter permease [Paenibacillus caui]